jgi:CHAT domain-containing protein
LFLDSLAFGAIQPGDEEAAGLLNREQELYHERQDHRGFLAQARLQRDQPERIIGLELRLAEAETAYAEVQAAIAARGDQLVDLIPGENKNLLSVPEVQALLDEETTLLAYYVLDQATLAFIITRNEFQTIDLEVTRAELVDQVGALREFAETGEMQPDSAVELYVRLIEPLKEHLTTSHLAIIPHDSLYYLPFAALTDGQRYLIDDYTLTTLPSAGSLAFLSKNVERQTGQGTEEQENSPPSPHQSLAALLSEFSNTPALVIGSLARDDEGHTLMSFTDKEAQAVADLYEVEPLFDDPDLEQIIRERAGSAEIVHIAAYCSLSPTYPLYSTIYFAPVANELDLQNDGYLEAHDIYNLNLPNTKLAVLSGCNTEPGVENSGVEVAAWPRAFFFAETPSVIISLWPVDDEASTLLMTRFHTHLRQGLSQAAALRQAQLDVRADYPNPYAWSGYMLWGDKGQEAQD